MKRLAPEERNAFEPHLGGCRSCQEMVNFAGEFVSLWDDAAKAHEIEPLEVALLAARS